MTLDRSAEEFLSWLAVEQGRARNTLAAYRRDLAAYETYLRARGLTLDEVSLGDVESYLSHRLSGGLSGSSVARASAAIRGLHRFRLREGLADADPTSRLPRRHGSLRLPKALSEEEVARLLAAPVGEGARTRRDRAILEVLYGTGIRISELVGASLADVQAGPGLLRVLGKGGRERLVPLGGMAAAALDDWLAPGGRTSLVPERWTRRDDSAALFLNARGARLTRQGAWGIVKHHAAAAGLADRVHPHVLRHSCATHMLSRGADIRVVQELLGHVSIATTQIYTRVTLEHLRRSYERAHPRA